MKKMKKLNLYLLLVFAIAFTSCEDLSTDVDVNYAENPTSADLANYVAAETFYLNFYNTINSYNGPGLSMTTMADTGSCSWGNAGMRDTSSEPRVAWNNDPTYGSGFITTSYFNSLYNNINDINALVKKIVEEGDDAADSSPRRTESIARFAQAATLGYVALVFDQVWLKDETGPLNDAMSVTPEVALAWCLEKIDQAIAIADSNSFTISSDFLNGNTLSSEQWSRFLNTFAARLMVNMPRNATQKAAVDWGRVLAYTNNGLAQDFAIISDNWTNWGNEWVIYQIYPGWGRVDNRVINMMDPNTPDYYTDPSGLLPESSSDDARLASDFQYLTSQDFIASRGVYHYSNYRYSRYDLGYHGSNWTGSMPEMLKAENDLYKAEAQMRLGDLSGAAATINAGTRTSRGTLPNIAADATAISDAIHYERTIELMNTGMGLAFFEMRGKDYLQAGTPLHYPVPGEVLLSGGFDIYTFGGSTGTAGEDYSTSGWR
jgi:hypothetical protein